MRYLSLAILLLLTLPAQSQTLTELWKKYGSQEFDEVLSQAKALEKNEPENIELKFLLGRVYTDIEMPDKALPYLLYVGQNAKSFTQAWAWAYLGTVYFQMGDYPQAKNYLQKTISLNVTPNVTRFAINKSTLFGFANAYNDFITKETQHIIFHFHPELIKTGLDTSAFMKERENAFTAINKFFTASVPKKIDFFVWNSQEALTTTTGSKYPYSMPAFSVCQTVYNQTAGHELTHVISHHSDKILQKSAMINEGTAVYFDQEKINRLQHARTVVRNAGLISITLKEFWNGSNIDGKVLDAVTGAFIEYLIEKKGKDKFLQLFRDQTYENAVRVYGSDFSSMEAGFVKSLLSISTLAVAKISDDAINGVIEKNNKSDQYYKILILLDGKPVTRAVLEKTDPAKIKNITVLKSKEEIKAYTTMDINGVLLVSLKDGKL
ncbi:MAG: tetratricopeptide repeat protein [Sphingobacteriaceae bacterium]|nr:tetratricopeptide repeat protein [Sphingobacteriaceae bacterium]